MGKNNKQPPQTINANIKRIISIYFLIVADEKPTSKMGAAQFSLRIFKKQTSKIR